MFIYLIVHSHSLLFFDLSISVNTSLTPLPKILSSPHFWDITLFWVSSHLSECSFSVCLGGSFSSPQLPNIEVTKTLSLAVFTFLFITISYVISSNTMTFHAICNLITPRFISPGRCLHQTPNSHIQMNVY